MRSLKLWRRPSEKFIGSRDLARLIRASRTCLAIGTRGEIETVVDHVEYANIRASTASTQSRFLTSVLRKYENVISKELADALKGIDVFGAEVPIPNAFARQAAGRPQIVVFEGLLHLIRFYGTLINTCSLLATHRPSAVCYLNGQPVPEAELVMTAGHSIIASFVGGNCDAPTDLARILGPKACSYVQVGLESATMFILAHEAGHVALGHTNDRYPRSERPPDDLAYREDYDEYKESELQADGFALNGMLAGFGDDVISSVLFFMSPFSFLEAFAPQRVGDHPLTVNRARHLAAFLEASGTASKVAIDIAKSQASGIERLLEQRRAGGGDISTHIEISLPAREARTLLKRIEDRVLREHGPLEIA